VSWKEPVESNEPPTERDIVKEICRPRTYAETWQIYLRERFGEDEIPEHMELTFE